MEQVSTLLYHKCTCITQAVTSEFLRPNLCQQNKVTCLEVRLKATDKTKIMIKSLEEVWYIIENIWNRKMQMTESKEYSCSLTLTGDWLKFSKCIWWRDLQATRSHLNVLWEEHKTKAFPSISGDNISITGNKAFKQREINRLLLWWYDEGNIFAFVLVLLLFLFN